MIIQIVVSIIGGTATLIGDPPNIPHGRRHRPLVHGFIANLATVAAPYVRTGHGRALPRLPAPATDRPGRRRHVLALDASKSIDNVAELRRTVPILVGTILVFFAHKALHL